MCISELQQIGTALICVIESAALAVVSTDPIQAVQLALLASLLRERAVTVVTGGAA